MLHGYKKSRYNIYDNLEFLGLNPYEQKHFCFGEGEGNDSSGGVDEGAPTSQAAQDEQDEAQGIGIDEAEATNLAGLIDQLSVEDNLGALETGYQGISATDKAEGLQDAMDRGDIGYNDAVYAGFVGHVEQANRDFDLSVARSIADKYGLEPSQVQPGFMQDPSLGPQTMSYRGPGSFNAATSEMATAAGMLAANLVDMTPGIFGLARGLAGYGRKDSFAGLVGQARGQSRDEQAESLSSKVQGYMDERAESQREANIAARGETDPSTAGIIDDYEEEVSQQGMFSSPQEAGIIDDYEEEVSQGGLFSAPDIAAPSSFDTVDLTGDVPFIPLAEPIPSVPTLAPEPAVEVVRAPVTRRPATDTFSILERIYGPDVAAKLLPTRIV